MNISCLNSYKIVLKSFKENRVIYVAANSFSEAESIANLVLSNWENGICYSIYKMNMSGFIFTKSK